MGQPAMFFRDTSSRHAVGEHVKKYEQPRRAGVRSEQQNREKDDGTKSRTTIEFHSISSPSRGAHD